MAQLHQYLYKDKVETVFLISDSKYDFISSTMAKQVISLGGDGRCLVPPHILKIMKGETAVITVKDAFSKVKDLVLNTK